MLLFALVAATSPVALASVLAVLVSHRGRLKGVLFAIGFIGGQAAFCILAFAVGGTLSLPARQDHPAVRATLEILFGVALVVNAVRIRNARNTPPRPRTSSRTDALRIRMSALHPLSALWTGLAFGAGGPKRIAITLAAIGAIVSAGLSDRSEISLVVLYVVTATVLVWVPVLLNLVFQRRATDWLSTAEAWSARHREPLIFYPSAVLGVGLLIGGIVQLVS